MDYLEVKGSCTLYTQTHHIGKHFSSERGILNRVALAREVFEHNYQGYQDPVLGRFLFLEKDGLDISKISLVRGSMNMIRLDLDYKAYFVRINQKSIIDLIVRSLSPRGIVGSVLGYTVEIPQTDLGLGVKPEYDPTANALVFSNNQPSIKPGDLVRARVLNNIKIMGSGSAQRYKIKASCKYPGCGKRL